MSTNVSCCFLPRLHMKPLLRSSKTSISFFYSSSNFVAINSHDQSFFWGQNRRAMKDYRSRGALLVRRVVGPGAPPPSEAPLNFINWAVGIVITVVIPFFTHKWVSLLKLKSEVDTAVEAIEEIVDAVGKVAEGVEKVAEDIAEDLPEGGRLRKAVDFVEHVAEIANTDAHLVVGFIDKVQEEEEKVEEYVENLGEEAITHTHHHSKEEENKLAHETHTEEGNSDETHKNY